MINAPSRMVQLLCLTSFFSLSLSLGCGSGYIRFIFILMYNWFFDKEVSKRESKERGVYHRLISDHINKEKEEEERKKERISKIKSIIIQCKIPIDLTIIIIVRWLYFVNRCLTKLKSYDNLVCYKITEHSFFVSLVFKEKRCIFSLCL
ncbi:hypothetical protein F4703DRAFT_1243045 [Phycomyces blakesleeanus]